jgi:hypothetical protein
VKPRGRKVGLYVTRSSTLPFDQWVRQHGRDRAANAQTELMRWFDHVEQWRKHIARIHRGSSHAKLARALREELDFVRGLVESVDRQNDKHFVVLQAMRLMRSVRDLEHNLALLNTVEARRKQTATLSKARRSKKCPYTRAQYDAALAQSGGKQYRLAELLDCAVKTLTKYGRPPA